MLGIIAVVIGIIIGSSLKSGNFDNLLNLNFNYSLFSIHNKTI